MKNTNSLMPRLQTTNPQPWTVAPTIRVSRTIPVDLQSLASGFESINLKQMDTVALLNRVDTKFVMTTDQLLTALEAVQSDYWMLEIKGQRLNHYRTLYFDTPDFELFHDHVTGRAERYKVRSREYMDSQLSFLEVKHKTRKDRTIKDRIPTSRQVVHMTPDTNAWLKDIMPVDGRMLEPKLWNTFTRMTLVSKLLNERVTLDVDLMVYTADRAARMTGLAVAEVKMDACNGDSPFLEQMRGQRIHEQGFSKYSMGVAMLYDQVKKNSLKPKMMQINKLMKGTL